MPSFISYSRLDRDIVIPIVSIIRLVDRRAFRDEDCIEPGKNWNTEIQTALRLAERVVLMWSVAASESRYVESEYRFAMETGKDVVPVILDNTRLPDELGRYQWIDMRPLVRTFIERQAVASAEALVARLGRSSWYSDTHAKSIIESTFVDLLRNRPGYEFSASEIKVLTEQFQARLDSGGSAAPLV